MKAFKFIALCALLAGCGGGSGIGGQSKGFYSLSLNLRQTDIVSPAVSGSAPNLNVPPDTIQGTLRLSYSGAEVGLRGSVDVAELCLGDGNCFSLPISGIISPESSLDFRVELLSHKFSSPWIEVNPFEDTVISTTTNTDNVSQGATSKTLNFMFDNSPLNLNLIPPVIPGQVMVKTDSGTYRGQVVRDTYSAGTNITLTLDKGVTTSNQYLTARVFIGSNLACEHNYLTGNTTNSGSFTCSYNPTPTGVSLTVNGFSTPQQLRVEYDFQGVLRCQDTASGSFSLDCNSGTINHGSGTITGLRFKFTSLSVPHPGQVQYQSGGLATNVFTYVLPPPSSQGYIKTVAGRVVEVVNTANGSVICNNQGNISGCLVSVVGNVVDLTFPSPPVFPFAVRYSLDQKVDFNPNIEVAPSQRIATSTASGYVRVRVRLVNNEVLTAIAPISFRIVPR